MREIKIGDVYRHFKGNRYIVTDIATNTETMESMVIYKDLNNLDKVWARPLKMFQSKIDRDKYPDEKSVYRFEKM